LISKPGGFMHDRGRQMDEFPASDEGRDET
jgi:hypothetical protein